MVAYIRGNLHVTCPVLNRPDVNRTYIANLPVNREACLGIPVLTVVQMDDSYSLLALYLLVNLSERKNKCLTF